MNPLEGTFDEKTKRNEIDRMLKEIESQKHDLAEEQQAVIGKVIFRALGKGLVTHEDFVEFISPLVTRKSDAKKLGIVYKRISEQTADDDELAPA